MTRLFLRTLCATAMASWCATPIGAYADLGRTVVLTGDAAPGAGARGGTDFTLFDVPALNDAGESAFKGFYDGSGSISGIWSEGGSDALQQVAQGGQHAPGTSAGVDSDDFEATVLNDAGRAAFSGPLWGIGLNGSKFRGIWSEGGVITPAMSDHQRESVSGSWKVAQEYA